VADPRSAFAATQAADLVAAYSGPGTAACTSGGVTAYGFAARLTPSEADAFGYPVKAPLPVQLYVPAGTWGTLTPRTSTLTIDDTALAGAYEVRAHDTSEDGRDDIYLLHEVGS
jgi:hypothetical protein